MKFAKLIRVLIITGLTVAISACLGGGGGGSSSAGGTVSGIGGTGFTLGTITGFGSVFVNGVEYETNSSTITIDDTISSENSLRVGMVVKITGTVNDDGITGMATTIEYDGNLEGPIANAPVVNADGNEYQFTVLGTTVVIHASSTVFENTTFNGLSAGDMVDVSGFYDSNGILRASYLKKEAGGFINNTTLVEAKGTVGAFNGTDSFTLTLTTGNTLSVTFDGATDLSDLPGATVANGMYVEVEGTLPSDASSNLSATRIEREGIEDDDNDVSIEGLITDYINNSNFKVNGIAVDASSASFSPAGLTLANGLHVDVEGDMVGGTLQADEVENRGGGESGDIRVYAPVASVDNGNNQITLTVGTGSIDVLLDSQTRMEDSVSNLQYFNITDISSGDFLEIEGYLDADGNLIASTLKRDSIDNTLLQGPVDSFNGATEMITILGISYSAVGASYEDINDVPTTSAAFFALAQVGDLVRLEDDKPADGVANAVEFED